MKTTNLFVIRKSVLDQLDAANGDLLLINIISTCFGHFYAHRQEIRVPLPMVVCPVIAVVMLESRVASCVHCVLIWL